MARMTREQMVALFDAARNVTALEVAKRYAAITPIKKGSRYVCRCPFPDHDDRHPSCTFWDSSAKKYAGFFICSCGRKGNGIDFVCQFLDLKPLDAVNLICNDFGLNTNIQLSDQVIKKREQMKDLRRDIQRQASLTHAINCSMIRWCNDRLSELSADDDANDDAIEKYLKMRIDAEYLVDAIFQADGNEGKLLAILQKVGNNTKQKYSLLRNWDKERGTEYVKGVNL